jgi:hypothetical protein
MKRCSLITVLLLLSAMYIFGQARGQQPAAPPTARSAAPLDLTGYWVSVVTEDWRWRMVTPPKGSFPSIPLNAEGRRIANAWDPAKDEAEGNQCKGYGAAAIMRLPTRLHITWENDSTLRVDTDAGTQTRMFQFGNPAPPAGEPTWQGHSVAQWEFAGAAGKPTGGSMKVVTTRMRPGYLQKNGVPYSGNAVVTEYFDVLRAPNGDIWMLVRTMVDDPQYLEKPPAEPFGSRLQPVLSARFGPFVRTTNFKKLPDAKGWNPTPCSAR